MGFKSFFKTLWRGTKRVVDHPIAQTALNVGSIALPQLQLVKFLKAYRLAKTAEQTIKGPGRGPEKFLSVFKQLEHSDLTPKEIKRFTELAVMVLDGSLEVHNADTGGKVHNFQSMTQLDK
jgi:hypothetical protein